MQILILYHINPVTIYDTHNGIFACINLTAKGAYYGFF